MSTRENRLKDTDIRLSEATAGDFFALLKPRVMALAVFTAFVGLMAAPGAMNPVIAVIAIGAIAIGAGAAGALNMWYDADIDALMSRTSKRPVPSGRVTPGEALGFGLVLSALSVITLGVLVGWLAASLLAFTIFFYIVIYTMWLKRSTPQNIVIGGAAGALPPVIGWAAATGAIGVESFILFLIIFLWTPPHFWALALFKVGDYAAAGIPMMPNVVGLASKTDIRLFAAPGANRRAALGVRIREWVLWNCFDCIGRGFHLARLEGPDRSRRGDEACKGAVCLLDFLSFRDLCHTACRYDRDASVHVNWS